MNTGTERAGGEPVRRTLAPAEPVFAPLIPDLRRMADTFRVNTSEVDAEIMELFVEQLGLTVSDLVRAVAARDAAGVRQGAHSLQGMGGTVGAPEVSVAGVELGAAARRDDFDRCARLLAALQEWVRQSEATGSGTEAT
jgi:HPt (histidine-containing phosphotransfer) domain-containing protein